MAGWADDPDLVATFRAEVDERLASLSAGLLELETHPAPRQLVGRLFRDAHTVKGSARMLGLDDVLGLAHRTEDLLGALRDGRFGVRRDLVDVLLAACDGMGRAVPGGDRPLAAGDLDRLVTALGEALAGADPVPVPRLDDGLPAVTPSPGPATPATAAPPPGGVPPAGEPAPATGGSASVRVQARKVYELLDVVGESELDARRIEQATATLAAVGADQARMVKALRDARVAAALPAAAAADVERLLAGADELAVATHELREMVEDARGRLALVRDGAMGLAMVPVRRILAAMPRLVRDVATRTGKQVAFVVEGDDVELDKQVLDGIADAVKHLVINAVDHGCETPEQRRAAGKPPQATVSVRARSSGGTVVVEVADDGAGIDEDAVRAAAVARRLLAPDSALAGPALLSLLFTPALSTSAEVTETSGRGVGLDVVQTAVDELGGAVEIQSRRGEGTTFAVTLPVTLGVLRCLVARVGGERYAIPVTGVVESVSLRDVAVHTVAGSAVVVRHGQSLPLLDLGAALGVTGERVARAAVVVRHATSGEQLAWAVDRLEGELELVVKDLGPFLGRLPMVTGATIDGDGSVVCLVDLRELAARATSAAPVVVPAQRTPAAGTAAERRPRVLVVEDSTGVRELERVILEGAGYEVVACVDGLDGAARLTGEPTDLVLSDVEMPGMDGFTLTRTIRRTRGWEHVPVVIMTSRGDDADRRAGLDAGASAYLLKHEFDQHQLVDTVRRLLGR